MKILVTGASGFIGRNLCVALNAIKEGKDKTRSLSIEKIYRIDRGSTLTELEIACSHADFIYHLAGINRTKDKNSFINENCSYLETVLSLLKKYNNHSPVMLASSIQASLSGRFQNSEYGKSKLISENILRQYGIKNGVQTLIYRLPNIFGKWCKPNYNSVIATFCHNIANNLPIEIHDPDTELDLLYIDDLINELINNLENSTHKQELKNKSYCPEFNNGFCYLPNVHHVRLKNIVSLLYKFNKQPSTLLIPCLKKGSFEKKLYSTFLSYLPETKFKFPLKTYSDNRGSFTEILKTPCCGQFSVNVIKPGETKGQHWHNTKWEFFIVVSGKAVIKEKPIANEGCQAHSFIVSSDVFEAVHMIPGYTHSITNISEDKDLIVLIWANELFDLENPDTFFERI